MKVASRGLLVLCGVLLLSASGGNQGKLSRAFAQNASPLLSAKIDLKAKECVRRMTAAYQALTSYSSTLELPNLTATLVFQRPNKIVVSTEETQVNSALTFPISRVVSDGKHLFALSPRDKTRYRRTEAPVDQSVIVQTVNAVTQGCLLRELLLGKDPLTFIPSSSPSVQLQSLAFDQPGSLDRVEVETVIAVFREMKSGVESQFTFTIGRDDHLLRRFILASPRPEGMPRPHIETYSNVQANPALTNTDFAFIPGSGTQAVAEFESLHDPALKRGAKPFLIRTTDMAGKALSLEQYKGKVVLLDFWATWCPPCVAEISNLCAMYAQFKAQGFEVISISADDVSRKKKLTDFIKHHRMSWRHIHDTTLSWSKRYGVKAYPVTILVGRDGTIAATDVQGSELKKAVQTALQKK